MYQYQGNDIDTDAEGYLLDHTQWSEGLVPIIAEQEGIELTEPHWEVIRFVRTFYLEFNTSPAVRMLVKAMEKEHGPKKEAVNTCLPYFEKVQQSKQQNWQGFLSRQNVYNIIKSSFIDLSVGCSTTESTYAVLGPFFNHK